MDIHQPSPQCPYTSFERLRLKVKGLPWDDCVPGVAPGSSIPVRTGQKGMPIKWSVYVKVSTKMSFSRYVWLSMGG